MSVSRRERLFALSGLVVDGVSMIDGVVPVSGRSSAPSARCPCCGRHSFRVHSRYRRRLADLPTHGARVEMLIMVRRFRRPETGCARSIFAERLDPVTVAPRGRRTDRLDAVVHHLGLALGGRSAPEIVVARDLVDACHALIRKRDLAGLDAWICAAAASPVANFAKGVAADRAAIAAAIEQPWSNGQTEGQICRLKTLKRQMGGRANIDLLKARMMRAA